MVIVEHYVEVYGRRRSRVVYEKREVLAVVIVPSVSGCIVVYPLYPLALLEGTNHGRVITPPQRIILHGNVSYITPRKTSLRTSGQTKMKDELVWRLPDHGYQHGAVGGEDPGERGGWAWGGAGCCLLHSVVLAVVADPLVEGWVVVYPLYPLALLEGTNHGRVITPTTDYTAW